MSGFSSWTKQNALPVYFVLAYAITWAFEIPLVAVEKGWTELDIPFAIHYLGGFGPMLAAVIVTSIVSGRRGVRQLFSGLSRWRVGWRWILFSVGAPIALFAIAGIINFVTSGDWPDLARLGEVEYLPYLGIIGVLVLWFLTWGLGEETGWRAFALPRLQNGRSALAASLILGVIHTFWHLPAFFYRDTYVAMGLAAGVPMLLLSVLAASIVFTWLYNSTRGSLLMVVIFHALFDMLSVSEAGGQVAAIVMSAGVMIWAVIVVVVFKPARLSRQEKQIAPLVVADEDQAAKVAGRTDFA